MPRASHRQQRASKSRYYLTLGRGERLRCLALRPWALYALVIGLPLVVATGAIGVANLAFPGNDVAAMAARQAEIRADYADRLAAMRAKIDQIADQSARDRSSFEAKTRALAGRQARLAQRAEAIADLARGSGLPGQTIAALTKASARSKAAVEAAPLVDPLLTAPLSTGSLPDSVEAFAPTGARSLAPHGGPIGPAGAKPHPDGVEIRSDQDKTSALAPNPLSDPALPIGVRLAAMNADVTRMDAKQLTAVAQIASSVAKKADRIRLAMAEVDLPLSRIKGSRAQNGAQGDVGGPFVPVKFEPGNSPFQNRLDRLQTRIARNERIARALPYLPFRQPLAGRLFTTSPFGVRLDPFLGRLAMHTGNDFRGAYGTQVMATAAGKVVKAGFDGGYGNRVEIDHGNGLDTLYAHLSAITVVEGQQVKAGEQIGRLGSTGRSTGPHLHYEVRIDGRPVDPLPFVHAGESLFASN